LLPHDDISQDGTVLNDIDSITQAFNHLFKQITNVTNALKQFEEIAGLFEVVQNALGQLNSLQSRLGTLEVSVEGRLKENEELKTKISQLSTNNGDLERKVSQLSMNVDNLTGQIHKERKHISDLLEFIRKYLGEDDDLSP
jgi:chromosome segregation ATPase